MDSVTGADLQAVTTGQGWLDLLTAHTKEGATLGKASTVRKTYGLMPLRHEYPSAMTGKVYEWPNRQAVQERTGRKYAMGAQLWLDAPVGFALTFKGAPQAVAAITANGNELLVHQLQGVNATPLCKNAEPRPPQGLAGLHWRELLLSVSEQLAGKVGLKEIGVVAAKRVINSFFFLGDAKVAERAYDGTAQKLHFKRGDDDIWHKPLAN